MTNGNIAIIPNPQRIVAGEGQFRLNDRTVIWAPDAAAIGRSLSRWIQEASGLHLVVNEAGDRPGDVGNTIAISLVGGDSAEGYQLDVSPSGITIRAATPAGLFYGCQSLRQLMPLPGSLPSIPALSISDQPRFPWRGLHLDVARHMFPIPFIKRYLDLMAFHKLNLFHWHLTDDQGWRIEIKRYPRLTEVGAWRDSTPLPADPTQGDGLRYGGYYTQEEIREIVAYARERHITVVPEIEMPGHALAALASYPQLGCRGEGYRVWPTWGIAEDVFCAGSSESYEFLCNVLREVLDLFPGEVIHIGGDECPKTRWQACPRCQATIKEQQLRDEDELQSHVIRRMASFLNAHGRRVIGWDEILEGGLAPNAMVMSWRGTEGGIAAAAQGHDVVMTPTEHSYFDYYQSADTATEPAAIGGLLTLEQAYAFDPLAGVAEDKRHHVLGGQGNVWTEYIQTPAQVEYMVFPRAAALAEAVWTGGDNRDYAEFLGRLRPHLKRLDQQGVHYRPLDA